MIATAFRTAALILFVVVASATFLAVVGVFLLATWGPPDSHRLRL